MINIPECSVVVITYNDAARLGRAVRSVLRQSLRNVEVIIADDASTDDTGKVARELQRRDPRVRYLRGEVNSGGCGVPRNRGVAAARAPYVMFLDSDDELTRHACKSMLLEIERTGADFVTGQISRLYEQTGKTARYYPALFARRRTVEGIAREPEMFLDSFSTNKLYRAELLRRVPFREDMHYEDHVFSTALYCAARRFAVVPWGVYLWHRASAESETRLSISLSLTDMSNVRSRIRAARLSDDILRENGLGDLVHERQRRFIRQDLRVYLNPLPSRDPAWIEEFVSVIHPYLADLDPVVFETVDPLLRVCCSFILDGRPDELLVAARSLNGPKAPPRAAVREGGAPAGARSPTRGGRSPRSGWPSCPTAPPGCATRRSSPARARWSGWRSRRTTRSECSPPRRAGPRSCGSGTIGYGWNRARRTVTVVTRARRRSTSPRSATAAWASRAGTTR